MRITLSTFQNNDVERGISILYFKGTRTHRDKHSFPTRRSSDLALGADATGRGIPHAAGGAGGRRAVPLARCRNRKSTRRNSSHRCISYAVFCLKKKKIIKTPQ